MFFYEEEEKKEENFLFLKKRKTGSRKPQAFFIVSKNVIKGAVQRNLIKRRLHHAFNERFGLIPKGWNFYFYTRKNILKKSYREIKQRIDFLLNK